MVHPSRTATPSRERMPQLVDLPNELLLHIALVLHTSASDSPNDAYNLALVARNFRHIAQDALHMHVSFRGSQTQKRPYRVGCLARTLIERPDLARRVQELDLALMWKVYSHEENCNASNDRCTCYWNNLKNLCLSYVSTTEACNKTWIEAIEAGFEDAIAGVVLHLLPALRILTIDNHHQTKYLDMNGNKVLVPRRIDTHYLFGSPAQIFDPSLVSGLANLTHVRSAAHIPWQLISLPSLETLHIGTLPTILNYPFELPLSSNTAFQVTSLTIPMNLVALENDYLQDIDGRSEHAVFSKTFCQGLTQLKRLNIQIYRSCEARGSRLGDHKTAPPGPSGYGEILHNLYSSSLETLMLDTSDVDTRAVKNWRPGKNYLENCVDPLTSLNQFPNLKTIIAPQEAFFNPTVRHFPSDLLLPSIRSIGIIDPTFIVADYFHHISSLKYYNAINIAKVELWCDHNPPLISIDDYFEGPTTSVSEHNGELSRAMLCSEMELLGHNGITCVANQKPRGWRDKDGLGVNDSYQWKNARWEYM